MLKTNTVIYKLHGEIRTQTERENRKLRQAVVYTTFTKRKKKQKKTKTKKNTKKPKKNSHTNINIQNKYECMMAAK